MKIHLLRLILFFGIGFSACAYAKEVEEGRPFDGNWVYRYSCEGTSGFYKERCEMQGPDFFSIYHVAQDGNKICMMYAATGQGQNRVDELDNGPSIFGVVKGSVATVKFRSAWTEDIGEAILIRKNENLLWHVTKQPSGTYWAPDNAVLSRDNSIYRRAAPCQPNE